jgi:hypothetical protein
MIDIADLGPVVSTIMIQRSKITVDDFPTSRIGHEDM